MRAAAGSDSGFMGSKRGTAVFQDEPPRPAGQAANTQQRHLGPRRNAPECKSGKQRLGVPLPGRDEILRWRSRGKSLEFEENTGRTKLPSRESLKAAARRNEVKRQLPALARAAGSTVPTTRRTRHPRPTHPKKTIMFRPSAPAAHPWRARPGATLCGAWDTGKSFKEDATAFSAARRSNSLRDTPSRRARLSRTANHSRETREPTKTRRRPHGALPVGGVVNIGACLTQLNNQSSPCARRPVSAVSSAREQQARSGSGPGRFLG